MTSSIKTTAVLLRPFELPSFKESLPAGEYEIESELLEPVDWIKPGTWTSSVLVWLQPRGSQLGLSRTLTVPLAELEKAVAKDKLTGKALTDFFLEEMLADPRIRLVMQADGVAETDLRELYSRRPSQRAARDGNDLKSMSFPEDDGAGVQGRDVSSPQAKYPRTQKLIQRALSDVASLRKREERNL